MAHTFDVTFKYLFRQSRGVLSHMLFGEVADWPNVEIPEVRNPRADLLARSVDGSLKQVEIQTSNDRGIAFRMLDYYVGLRRLYGEHVQQTLLYVGREPLRMEGWFESPSTRHEFAILNLRELDGTALLESEDWADNEWALLTKTDPEKVIRVVFDKLKMLSGDEQEKAASTFAILGGIIGMEELLERRFQSEMIDLMENKILGPAIRRGLEQGLEQGRSQGRAELLKELLEARFGGLPPWVDAKIAGASPEALKQWALRFQQAESLEALLG